MIFKFLILSILFCILSASPVKQSGSRASTSNNNYQNYYIREQTQPLDLSSKNRYNDRNGQSTSVIQYACTQCREVHTSSNDLHYHKQTFHNDSFNKNRQKDGYAPYTSGSKKDNRLCSKCGKSYSTPGNLQHYQHNEKEVICNECGNSFTSGFVKDLYKQSYHRGFDCTKCGKKYSTEYNLKNHHNAEH